MEVKQNFALHWYIIKLQL